MPRLFIAIELGDNEKKRLETVQRTLAEKLPMFRWIKPASIHLTLKFLGNQQDIMVPRLKDVVSDVAGRFDPFSARLEGLGAFPSPRRPRIIWCGVHENGAVLPKIAEAVESRCTELRIPPEDRAYTPHLTLARAKKDQRIPDIRTILESSANERFCALSVRELSLMESTLTHRGAIYTVLHRVPFQSP
jgi:2'-5' RNA ligase